MSAPLESRDRFGLLAASRALNTAAWVGAAGFLAVMLGLVFIQIGGRYLLQNAPSWTEEAARYAMVWSGLLGGVVAFQQDADPALVRVHAHSPLWLRRAQAWARTVCVGVLLGVLLTHSWGFVARAALRDTESLGWNLGVVVAIVPLYAVLVLVQAALKLAAFELALLGADKANE